MRKMALYGVALGVLMASAPAAAQDVVMRRPLPNSANGPSSPVVDPDPEPDPDQTPGTFSVVTQTTRIGEDIGDFPGCKSGTEANISKVQWVGGDYVASGTASECQSGGSVLASAYTCRATYTCIGLNGKPLTETQNVPDGICERGGASVEIIKAESPVATDGGGTGLGSCDCDSLPDPETCNIQEFFDRCFAPADHDS